MSLGKKDIINNIKSKAQISNDTSNKVFESFVNIITYNSKTKIVKISKFGSFINKNSPQRLGRNPKTKENFIISKRKKIVFKSSNKVKNFIN